MKKKISIILTTIIILIISYLIYSNKRLDGIYIKKSSIYLNQKDSTTSENTQQSLLKIKNQKFNRYYHSFNGIPEVEKYFSFLTYINFKPENKEYSFYPSNIENINNDSLVLSNNFDTTEYYLKIPDSLKNDLNEKFEISNKVFKSTTEKFIDTVFFSKNFMIFKNGKKNYKDWGFLNREVLKIDGFDIMLIDSEPVLIIKKQKEYFKFYKYDLNSKLIEIKLEELNIDTNDFNEKLELIKLAIKR